MKEFGKIALRVLASLVIGALGSEIINVMSNDPNHYKTPDNSTTYTLVLGTIAFLVLTFFASRKKTNA